MIHRFAVALSTVMALSLLVGSVEAARALPEQSEAESNLPFLFAAFAVTWAGFFAYVLYVWFRQRELRRELRALRKALEEREESKQSPSKE